MNTSSTSPPPAAFDRKIVDRWQLWVCSAPGQRCWAHWAQRWPALADIDEDTLGHPTTGHRTDAMQACLVAIAQGYDNGNFRDEATLTLLVQLRPGLLALTRSLWNSRQFQPFDDLAFEVKAVFFETLMRHDLARRPTKIAANLLLDTRQRVVRTSPRRPSSPDASLKAATSADSLPAIDTSSVSVRVALRSEVAELSGVGHFGPSNAELVYRAWFLEHTNRDIANAFGITPSLVSTRLNRVRRGLADRLAVV